MLSRLKLFINSTWGLWLILTFLYLLLLSVINSGANPYYQNSNILLASNGSIFLTKLTFFIGLFVPYGFGGLAGIYFPGVIVVFFLLYYLNKKIKGFSLNWKQNLFVNFAILFLLTVFMDLIIFHQLASINLLFSPETFWNSIHF